MSYQGNRSSAEKENSQNNSLHGQASPSSGNGQATSGGSANPTLSWSPRDQGRDSQEERSGIRSPQMTFEPRQGHSTSRSAPRIPSTSNSDLLRRLTMARAPRATSNVSPTPSSVSSSPSSPVMPNTTTFTREMQHYGKDANNFYEDADTDRTADYPSTPPESSSGSSSVWSNQSDRSSRGGTPAYDQDGWRAEGFLTSPRR